MGIGYTKEDYEKWEGDWELIKGVPYAMAAFGLVSYQSLSCKIFTEFDKHLCLNCKALMEIEVEFDNTTIVTPDVVMVCNLYKERIKYYILSYQEKIKIYELVNGEYIHRDFKDKLRFQISECEFEIDFNNLKVKK